MINWMTLLGAPQIRYSKFRLLSISAIIPIICGNVAMATPSQSAAIETQSTWSQRNDFGDLVEFINPATRFKTKDSGAVSIPQSTGRFCEQALGAGAKQVSQLQDLVKREEVTTTLGLDLNKNREITGVWDRSCLAGSCAVSSKSIIKEDRVFCLKPGVDNIPVKLEAYNIEIRNVLKNKALILQPRAVLAGQKFGIAPFNSRFLSKQLCQAFGFKGPAAEQGYEWRPSNNATLKTKQTATQINGRESEWLGVQLKGAQLTGDEKIEVIGFGSNPDVIVDQFLCQVE